MKFQNVDFHRLSQQELAEAFGVSTRTIRTWGFQDLPRAEDQTYDLPQAIRWFAERRSADGQVWREV